MVELADAQAQVVNITKDCEDKISKIKSDCEQEVANANSRADQWKTDNAAAERARKSAEKYRKEQFNLLNEEKEKIDKLAEEKIANKKVALEKEKTKEVSRIKSDCKKEISSVKSDCKKKIEECKDYYRNKYIANEAWHILVFSFCVFWLVIQAVSSNYLRSNVVELYSWIEFYCIRMATIISEWIPVVAKITENISNEIVFNIAYWLVFIIVGLLSIFVIYVVPVIIIIYGSYTYLKSKAFDRINRWSMVVSGVVLVVLSSELCYTPHINMLVLWFCIQVLVPFIRYVIIPFMYTNIDKFHNMDDDVAVKLQADIVIIVIVIAALIFFKKLLFG